MTLEELLAERCIERATIRLARAMDQNDWDVWRAVLLPDTAADFGAGQLEGCESIIASIRSYLDNCGVSQHMLGNFTAEIDADTARSRCYVADMHMGGEGREEMIFRTLGEYHDEWRKVDGTWRLTKRFKDNRAIIGPLEIFDPPQGG